MEVRRPANGMGEGGEVERVVDYVLGRAGATDRAGPEGNKAKQSNRNAMQSEVGRGARKKRQSRLAGSGRFKQGSRVGSVPSELFFFTVSVSKELRLLSLFLPPLVPLSSTLSSSSS